MMIHYTTALSQKYRTGTWLSLLLTMWLLLLIPASASSNCTEPTANDSSRCGPGTVTLPVSGSTGLYYWYDAPSGGSLVTSSSGGTFQTPTLSETDTFYVAEYDTTTSQDALNFDGSDDYVALDKFYNTTGQVSQLTLEAWVKTTESGGGLTSNWAIIDFDRSEYFNMYVTGDDGRVGFSTTDQTGTRNNFYSSTTVNDGNWHHIVAVYDGTDKIIYIDGVQDATKTNAHSGNAIGTGAKRYGFIGDGSEASSFDGSRNAKYYKGEVDEIRIWDMARTQAQIQNNMNNCLNGSETGLDTYFRMNGSGSIDTMKDMTGNGHNGVLKNMALPGAWLSSGPNVYRCPSCESDRDMAVAQILDVPQPDLGEDTCISGTSFAIDAGASYSSYIWQDASTNQTFTATSAGAYHVKVDSAGLSCSGSDTIEVVMPLKPTGHDKAVCEPGEYQLNATGGSGNYKWYDQPTGGTALQPDTGSFTTPFVNSTDTFYVASYDTMANQGALSFDGTDDYIAIQNVNYNTTTEAEVTVEAWVRTTDGSDQIITSFDRNEYWRFEINGEGAGTGQVGFDVNTDAGQLDFGGNTRIDDGAWHHVAAVFDNGDVSIYIDGSLDNSTTLGSTFGSGQAGYGFVGVGSEASNFNGSTGPNDYFNGDLDEVRVWNVAKTQSEIQNRMNQCLLGNENGLLLNYTLEDGGGATASDQSINGNDGALQNMSTPSAWIDDGANIYGCPSACESPRDTVILTVNPEPTNMLGNDVCASSSVTLDAGAGYSSYLWNTGETTQTIVADTNGFYSVQVDSNGTPCTGTDGVTVSILSKPTASSDTSRCGPGTVDLTVSGSTGNYFWYDSPLGDSVIATGATYTTPALSQTDTFYVSAFGTDTSDEAMTFDGTDDYVALDKFYNTAGQVSQLTLEAWVKTSVSGEGVNDNWAIIDFDRSEYFNMYVTGDDGRVGFSTTDETGTIDDFYSTTKVNDGNWHHIVAVYDGTDKIIYIDGVQDATKANAHSGNAIGTGVTRYGFIGDGSEASSFDGGRNGIHFNGQIDEVRIWNEARNILEIQNKKDDCLAGTEAGLAAYYKMEDGDGSNTLTDHSLNSHNGTLQNMDLNAAWINTGQPINCSCGESPLDTVEVNIDPVPSVNLGKDTCVLSSSLELDAGSGYSSYKWKDGSTTQTLSATSSQAYWVEVDSAGTTCSGSDTIVLSMGTAATPTLQSTSVCGSGNADLIASSSGTVKWWDQASGGTLLGKGDTLTVGPLSSDSVFYASTSAASEDALSFDGSDDYVALDKSFNTSGKFAQLTLEAWVQTSVSGAGTDDNWSIIDFDRSEYFNMYVTGDDGRVGFSTTDNSGATDNFYSSTTVNDGKWHHIVAVYNGTDKIIYIDGVEDATKSNAHSGNAIGTGATRYGFIGDGSEASSFDGSRNGRYYKGTVDELRIWNSARTQTQIDTYKDSCLNGSESGLDAYYRIKEGGGATISDFAGNSDGVINGATWNTNGNPFQCSPCSESERVSVTANVVERIDSVTYKVSYPGENGSVVFLESHGGSGQYDYREMNGIINYNGVYEANTIEETLPNGGTFDLEVRDDNGCKDTVENITTTPLPFVSGIPTANATSEARKIPEKDDWFYIVNSANEAIAAINPGNNNLGTVTADVYLDDDAQLRSGEAYLSRHYVIQPQSQPASNVDVRLYLTNTEFINLADTVSALQGGVPPTKSQLGIMKYQGPSEDSIFDLSDAVSTIDIPQNTNGQQFGHDYIEFSTPGFSEFWPKDDGSSSLPIELMSFDAELENGHTSVKWATQTEINNDFFTVERSRDGQHFETVAKREGAGNSNSVLHYQITDEDPYQGVSYYRLKQTDYDGKYSYSETVSVNNKKNSSEPKMKLFPNPTFGTFHLQINGFGNEEALTVVMRNRKGEQIFTKQVEVHADGSARITNRPSRNLPAGLYYVSIITSDTSITKKIVVQ